MAEKKKTAAKKTTKTAAKKTTAQKTANTSKPAAAKKKPAAKQPSVQSMKVCKDPEPFMTAKITQQTVYWLIIGLAVMLLGMWILKVQNEVQSIYDQIERINIIGTELPSDIEKSAESTEQTSVETE